MIYHTIHHMLSVQAETRPDDIAIKAPGRNPLTYQQLHTQVDTQVRVLNTMGIGHHDRVGIALSNGPEMAVAFLAVAAGACSAPLNLAYRESEFDFYLTDLNAKALIVEAGTDSPARDAARKRGISVIELVIDKTAEAGIFSLVCDKRSNASNDGFAQSDDVALILHTSGTTSRPKIVPLTHANICHSADNHVSTLKLTDQDSCLNIMPLFHIHALISALLASLTAGANIVCTPGFSVIDFLTWLATFRPTWYTSAPTMHQAILELAVAHPDIIKQNSLRFIRSAAASLPPTIISALEDVFGRPVIESYGMTEAAAQITSNPLPPQARKVGSVGMAMGPEVAVMDEVNVRLKPGETGEIMIRGLSIFGGYENNETANQSAFEGDWLRTGDQGFMDEEGYLFITGRLKEIINRGGENISPREIDEVLLEHPGVAQAVTFGIPHPQLGEDIATAVVMQENKSVTEDELRGFAATRLADFKVPRRLIMVQEVPTGPTGKIQRNQLAEKLGFGDMTSGKTNKEETYSPPRNDMERTLVKVWCDVMSIEEIGIHDNFFELGGHSLHSLRLLNETEKITGQKLPPSILFQKPTIEQFAAFLQQKSSEPNHASLIPMKPSGFKPPFFCLPGNMGNVFKDLSDLSRHFDPDQPLYGLQDYMHNPAKIKSLAKHYIDEIRTVQPQGPYYLGGICHGGVVVFEMAQQLQAMEEEVALVALIEPAPPQRPGFAKYSRIMWSALRRILKRGGYHSNNMVHYRAGEQLAYVRSKVKIIANQWALARYVPARFSGSIYVILGNNSDESAKALQLDWYKFTDGEKTRCDIPGDHHTITGKNGTVIDEAGMRALAEYIKKQMDAVLSDT